MKSYIIRLEGNELSETLAKDCFDAAKSFGYDVEYFKAIDKTTVDAFFNQHTLKIAKDAKMAGAGTRGCFASHFSLWKRIRESNELGIILEHDGLLLKSVDAILNQVKDVCHLDPNDPYNSNYALDLKNDTEIGVKPYSRNKAKRITGKYFKGAYSYILTPQGANKLIYFVHQYGAFTADRTICETAAELQSTICSHAMLHPFFNSAEQITKFSTRT
jgi:GR25 family glycosyltransferase involved in LPS biosynthesis